MKHEQKVIKKQIAKEHTLLDTLLDTKPRDMSLIQNQVVKIQALNKKLSILKKPLRPKTEPWMHDPVLKDIMNKMCPITKLKCPTCGDSDHGNIVNGRPWCFKCNAPLMPATKSKRNNMATKDDTREFERRVQEKTKHFKKVGVIVTEAEVRDYLRKTSSFTIKRR